MLPILQEIKKLFSEKFLDSLKYFNIHTVKDKNLCTIACFWSKTTLIASSVCEIGVNPPLRKINTFCLRSLALSVPIYRHFQSNGDNWRSIKDRRNFFYLIAHYINFFVQRLILRQLSLFDWKCL